MEEHAPAKNQAQTDAFLVQLCRTALIFGVPIQVPNQEIGRRGVGLKSKSRDERRDQDPMTSVLCCACVDAADKGIVQVFNLSRSFDSPLFRVCRAEPEYRHGSQECGKYKGLADPGCSVILWPIQVLAMRLRKSLRIL